jgi:hypothetical protein
MMRDFASGRQKAYRMVVSWFGFVTQIVSLRAREMPLIQRKLTVCFTNWIKFEIGRQG